MDSSLLTTQAIAASTVVWVIQILKRSQWCKFLDVNTSSINRVVSALAALLTASAIHWTWDAATATLTISGLTAMAVGHFLWGALQQFVGQEMIYEIVYKPKTELKQAASTVAKTTISATAKVVDAIEHIEPVVMIEPKP